MPDLEADRPPAPADPPAPGGPAGADEAGVMSPGVTVPGPAPEPRRRMLRPLHLALAVVVLLAGSALFLSGYSLGARNATTPGTPADERALFAPFWDVYQSITSTYAGGDVDRRKLVEGAIDGMIKALGDPYSSYMTPEELRSQRESIGGQFEGIGAEVSARTAAGADCTALGTDCRMTVVAPIAGSPAEKSGLLAGDVIRAVDGATVDGQTLDDAIKRVRGPKGTTVTLTVVRGGGAPFDVQIVRDVIVQRQIETRDLAGGSVTYIRITAFSDNSAADFAAALADATKRGVKKVILDLRDNPGGYVKAARAIASQFVAEGPLFWEEDAAGRQEPTNAEPGGVATDRSIRVAVLVNKGSASASEIVAGALQDTGRATLLGETTYGKGTVQEWVDLPEESGGFRLTIAKWLTPTKRWIHGKGLTPDVVVAADAPAGSSGDAYIEAALSLLGATADVPLLLAA